MLFFMRGYPNSWGQRHVSRMGFSWHIQILRYVLWSLSSSRDVQISWANLQLIFLAWGLDVGAGPFRHFVETSKHGRGVWTNTKQEDEIIHIGDIHTGDFMGMLREQGDMWYVAIPHVPWCHGVGVLLLTGSFLGVNIPALWSAWWLRIYWIIQQLHSLNRQLYCRNTVQLHTSKHSNSPNFGSLARHG